MRRARLAAAAFAAVLALTGCGGDAFPEEEPTDGPVTASGQVDVPTADAGEVADQAISAAASVGATKTGGAGTEVARCPAVEPAEKVRGGLAELTLDCLGPGPATQLSALRGPLVLNVWASWCGPCADETPHLIEAYEAIGDKVRFLGLDVSDKPDQARQWLSFMGVPWPSLQDPEGKSRARLHVPGPPVTLFIRPDGTVADVHYGAFTSAGEVAAAVADHLGVTS